MIDTLTPCPVLTKLGELLRQSCPENDCTIYLATYEQYLELKADYSRITEAFPDLSPATLSALEQSIRRRIINMGKLWTDNYAVVRYRETAGMSGRKDA